MAPKQHDAIDMALMLSALLVLLALAILLKACVRDNGAHSDKVPHNEITREKNPYAY